MLVVPKSNFLVDPFPILTPILFAKFSIVFISFLSFLGDNKALSYALLNFSLNPLLYSLLIGVTYNSFSGDTFDPFKNAFD